MAAKSAASGLSSRDPSNILHRGVTYVVTRAPTAPLWSTTATSRIDPASGTSDAPDDSIRRAYSRAHGAS
jgi:hypothetical protein